MICRRTASSARSEVRLRMLKAYASHNLDANRFFNYADHTVGNSRGFL